MEGELTFHKVLGDVDRLSVDEQETLVNIVRRRLADARRKQIVADVIEGEKEFAAGVPQACVGERDHARDHLVKRELIHAMSFARRAKRLLKRRPGVAHDVATALTLLSDDAFDPRLRSHKLRGPLEDRWACSVGTHDDVY